MTVEIEDTAEHSEVSAETLAELTDLTAFLYAELHLTADVELVVSLVTAQQMEELHLEWMELSSATDVMSFPMDQLRPGTADSPVAEGTLGDIVLCPEVAAAQAHAAGHSTADELCLLTTHGLLHLLGYDHDDADARQEMFSLQKQLLESYLGREAPVPTEGEDTAEDKGQPA